MLIAGRYRLRDQIAAGGMGVVFRADDVGVERLVAVKVLRPELLDVPELLAQFHREADAASRLAHPNTVAVIDRGVGDGGAPFLVMEYARGVSLAHILRRDGPPPLARVLDLVGQVLAGLDHAHAVGVIHADIKSENVLVEELADGVDLVKVVDFGLARIRDTTELLVEDLSSCGTPEYMPPEVIAGARPTVASDLYAVGCVLYELLTGATPFAGGPTVEILVRHQTDAVVPPSLRCPDRDIPPAIERACLRALARRPIQRFADARAFAAALEDGDVGRARLGPRPARHGTDPDEAAIPEPVRSELPTRPLDASPPQEHWRRPGPSESTDVLIEHLRRAVGVAIVSGDADDLAGRYLELARVLASARQPAAAIVELEEAIDVITGGDGAATRAPPRALWRLLLALARLHERAGRPTLATRIIEAAVRHART